MTKRIVSLVIVVALAMTLLASTAMAWEYRYSACSNGKPLNVRSGPSKSYPVIGSIPYGEQVGVDHDLGNGWSELIWGSVPGYAMTSLMTKSKPGPYTPGQGGSSDGGSLNNLFKKAKEVTPYTITLKGVRASGSANVRWAPSKQSTLQRAYAPGKEMTVIAELGTDWYQVQDPSSGAVGFVNKAYVNK